MPVIDLDKNPYPGATGSTVYIDLDKNPYPGAVAKKKTTTTTSSTAASDQAKRDAYEYLSRTFNLYGLGSLAPKILEYVQQGYGADTISLMLQETPEYKQRFKANQTRITQGLPVLSPAEYIALESSYRQILESNGLPKGFYDSQDDFANWIGGDVSPQEIQTRAQLAANAVNNSDTAYLQSLRDYGLGSGDLVAAMLDRQRALPLLERTVREAQIGAEARRQGLQLSQDRAGYFESLGVSQDLARQSYGFAGQYLGTLEQLGNFSGEQYTQADLENELLGGSGLASEKRKRLQTQETSRFSGSGAVGQSSFAGPSRGEF